MATTGHKIRSSRFVMLILSLVVVLIGSMVASISIGAVHISPELVWSIVQSQITNGGVDPTWSQSVYQIVWNIRVPRTLLAVVIGSSLAVIGVSLQTLVRNPLADPQILGVSSGAAVGAVLALLLGVFDSLGAYAVPAAACLGGGCSFAIVLLVARRGGRISPIRIILAGIAVSHVASAIASFLVIRAPNAAGIKSVLFWLMGSVAGASWATLGLPALVLLVGSIFLMLQARSLNAVLVGEETASTLGVNTSSFRKRLVVVAAVLTGVTVSVSGTIGFVGLMVPHVARLVVGADHRRVLPVSLLTGAIFLLWADVFARWALAPEELPIGIITSFLGGPFFIWLMVSRPNALGGGR